MPSITKAKLPERWISHMSLAPYKGAFNFFFVKFSSLRQAWKIFVSFHRYPETGAAFSTALNG
jgi:hypothetical protein